MCGLCKIKICYDDGNGNFIDNEYCAIVPGNTFTDIVKQVENYYNGDLVAVEVVGIGGDLMCIPMEYFDTIKEILDNY